jgi:hypothetical protein
LLIQKYSVGQLTSYGSGWATCKVLAQQGAFGYFCEVLVYTKSKALLTSYGSGWATFKVLAQQGVFGCF